MAAFFIEEPTGPAFVRGEEVQGSLILQGTWATEVTCHCRDARDSADASTAVRSCWDRYGGGGGASLDGKKGRYGEVNGGLASSWLTIRGGEEAGPSDSTAGPGLSKVEPPSKLWITGGIPRGRN